MYLSTLGSRVIKQKKKKKKDLDAVGEAVHVQERMVLMWWSTISPPSNDAINAHPSIQHHPTERKSSPESTVATERSSDVQDLDETATPPRTTIGPSTRTY